MVACPRNDLSLRFMKHQSVGPQTIGLRTDKLGPLSRKVLVMTTFSGRSLLEGRIAVKGAGVHSGCIRLSGGVAPDGPAYQ
jgi:hypothetical protein